MKSQIEQALRSFVRGESSLEALGEAGVEISTSAGQLAVHTKEHLGFEVGVIDVAFGLVALSERFGDLQEWAQLLLGAPNLVAFDEELQDSRLGNLFLNAIWDISFGNRPELVVVERAKAVLRASQGV